jgi:hypothetical protein
VSATLLAAAEPSKVPLFIAGGVLVAWAIVLSAIGLTRPEFPYNARGARAVMLVSFVFVIITIATAVVTDP